MTTIKHKKDELPCSTNKFSISISANFLLGDLLFQCALLKQSDNLFISAKYFNNSSQKLTLMSILKRMDINLDESITTTFDIDFNINKIILSYQSKTKEISLTLDFSKMGTIIFSTDKDNSIKLKFILNQEVKLNTLPIVGSFFTPENYFKFNSFSIAKSPEGYLVDFDIVAFINKPIDIKLPFSMANVSPPNETLPNVSPPNETPNPKSPSSINWIKLDKKLGIISLSQIGVTFNDGKIILYLDASIKLSILTISLIEFNIGISITKFDFPDIGLNGLFVTLDKPPLKLSGGLFRSHKNMYAGQLTIEYNQISASLLACYEVTDTGVTTFFAFLSIRALIGGPPFMTITGLSAGIGINRKIILPKLDDVVKFPFIQIAMGKNKLSNPADVLSTMNSSIIPSEGDYFITAGISFSSFGLIKSVVLVNVEFGNRFVLSVLGQSVLSIPPNPSNGIKPIAYAELAIKAYYSHDEGILSVAMNLTKESYLLHESCHLTGGFIFCTWFKGAYKGDFVLSLGGYHPRYINDHYPAVAPLGINWQISSSINFKGNMYFAITPNAIMAGGIVSINFNSCGIHAWFEAKMDFLMEWKPFHYDIFIGVSIGVKFWFFKIELGARLHLSGPEFSGSIYVRWYIISFTINFGTTKKQPLVLTWKEFCKDFYPDRNKILSISAKGIAKETINPTSIIVNQNLSSFTVSSTMPCNSLKVNGAIIQNDKISKIYTTPTLCVRPMNDIAFNSTLSISISNNKGIVLTPVEVIALLENYPPALWGSSKNNKPLQFSMIKDIISNVTISFKKNELISLILSKYIYKLEDLTANQIIGGKDCILVQLSIIDTVDDKTKSIQRIRATINNSYITQQRGDYLKSLSDFNVSLKLNIRNWSSNTYLLAEPKLRTIGSIDSIKGEKKNG